MSKVIPNFLVGGPPKGASTSIYFYLSQHPEIYTSPEKQTRFFSVFYDKGIEFYLKTYFSGVMDEKAVGEATPTYFLLPFVAKRIYDFNPQMKIIFCLRNPVERAFSGWNMRINIGTEHMGFKEALEENFKQHQKLKFETEEEGQIWQVDMLRNDRLENTGNRSYLEGGMYSHNLKAYLKYFPIEQIKVIFMEDIQNDLRMTMKEVFAFLGVDPEFVIPNIEKKNTYKKSKIKFLDPIIGKNKKLSKAVSKMIPDTFKQKILNKMYIEGSKQKMTPEDKQFAYKYFKNEIIELEKLLNKDLSNWKLT